MIVKATETKGREPLRRLLLAHHSQKSIHHTLLIQLAGRDVRLCARCTGLAVGFVLGVSSLSSLLEVFSTFPFLIAILPIPATIDWLLQVFGVRESTNPRRVVTAIPIGVLYPAGAASLIGGSMLLLGYFIIFWTMYAGALYLLFRRTRALDRYIRSAW